MDRVDEESAIHAPIVEAALHPEVLDPAFDRDANRLAHYILKRQQARERELECIRRAHNEGCEVIDWQERAYEWRCIGDGWHRCALIQARIIEREYGIA